MRTLALAILVAAAALAEGDPPGTIALRLHVGETFSLEAPPGSNVLCDDLATVAAEFRLDEKGFLLRAKQPGETLCGLWLAQAKPGGLYRVTVIPEEKRDAGSAPSGADDRAPRSEKDGGTRQQDAGGAR